MTDVPEAVPLWLRLSRDLLVISVLFGLWWLVDGYTEKLPVGYATWASRLVGLAIGSILLASFHEWGHFLGARLSGADTPILNLHKSFMFDFDIPRSTSRQFQWMSIGGTVLPVIFVMLFFAFGALSDGARVGFLAAALVLIVGSALVEFPIIFRSLRGMQSQDSWDIHMAQRQRNNLRGFGSAFGLASAYMLLA